MDENSQGGESIKFPDTSTAKENSCSAFKHIKECATLQIDTYDYDSIRKNHIHYSFNGGTTTWKATHLKYTIYPMNYYRSKKIS